MLDNAKLMIGYYIALQYTTNDEAYVEVKESYHKQKLHQ